MTGRLLKLVDLCDKIASEIERSGKVEGSISFNRTGRNLRGGHYVNRIHSFLGFTSIVEGASYDSNASRSQVLDDCREDIAYLLAKRYDVLAGSMEGDAQKVTLKSKVARVPNHVVLLEQDDSLSVEDKEVLDYLRAEDALTVKI